MNSGWNHRVVKYPANPDTTYGLHEIFYDSSGEPDGMSDEPILTGETVEELRESLTMMLKSLDEQVLHRVPE